MKNNLKVKGKYSALIDEDRSDRSEVSESKQLKKITEIDLKTSIYIKQLTNKTISSLPTLNKRDARIDNISKEHIYNLGADKVILREINSISVNTTKTLKRIIANFTEKNNIKNLKSNSVDYRVTMDIEEMAMDRGALNKKDLENSKRKSSILKDFRKKIKKDIATLRNNIVLDNNEHYINTSILATGAIQNKGKTLYVTLNPDFADNLLKTNTIIKYPKVLDLVDARDKNTYALGNAISEHFSKYTNQQSSKSNNRKQTYDRLKVSTCLSYFPEIMRYEDILEKGASWNRENKEKLENSLDKLQDIGFLMSWHYGFSNGEILSDEKMIEYTTDYSKWISLNIYFTPNRYWELIKDQKVVKEKEKELKRIDEIYTTIKD